MSIFDQWGNLSEAEQKFVTSEPKAAAAFKLNAEVALKEARKRFTKSTLHNGSGDAFRHCYWSALNARDQGATLAKAFGDAHEDWAANPADEKSMDLHNNGVGYDIGGPLPSNTSDGHVSIVCFQAWIKGKLKQIDKPADSDAIYTKPKNKP